MFLVDKTHLTSHFKSIGKKPTHGQKGYQLPARFFDEKVILHLKTLTPPSRSSIISLSWLSKAVSFLSMVHSEAQDQISSLGSESDYYQALYMDYSVKVLDLCNLISSAVQQLTERRLLMNLGLRLINSSGQIPSPEKLKKAKDALIRSVHHRHDTSKEKGIRAKALIEELTSAINSLPLGKTSSAKDMIRRTLHGLGVLTVFIASVLVAVLYGQSDSVEVRVPDVFLWADSVNRMQTQIFELIKPKQTSDGGRTKGWLLELDDTASRSLAICDLLDEIVFDGDDNRSRLENGVKELGNAAANFSDVVDGLTNGVNGLFNSVLKTRNGVLDGVRKATW
ncbi:protein BPS1, chloroplastic-like [Cynara cardunculus var. scolymus]|uniref:BYPASS-related protein n=1 Tax=Cynara cardunculus var. scolymus TaxID=59895 RepID=A0A103Y9Z2_CYNCS|nr:protein BPS1, chloroplastic-like [Cynara cardunculus var. scolymus]KVI05249.1 hypothetical protein Ccrd_016398 [Cynara cardunculus var. scolymus]